VVISGLSRNGCAFPVTYIKPFSSIYCIVATVYAWSPFCPVSTMYRYFETLNFKQCNNCSPNISTG